ncbi:16758_t:CDS:2, partial [Gigaspora rosea]
GSGRNTIPGNSNWFEWKWPTEGEYLKPARLNQQNLVKELKLRGIEASKKENKNILVSNLEVQLETVNEITELSK